MKKLIVILFLFSVGCKSEIETVAYCRDGDTIVLSNKEIIRILDVDSPELHQAWGVEAKRFTERLLLSKAVTVERHGHDKYHRTLARIYIDHQNFSYLLVSEGLAHANYNATQSLKNAYFKAKDEHKGLFSQSWIYPSQYRRLNKHK